MEKESNLILLFTWENGPFGEFLVACRQLLLLWYGPFLESKVSKEFYLTGKVSFQLVNELVLNCQLSTP